MYIVRGLQNLPDRWRGAAVAIGNFDGVHLGHQGLFRTLGQLAEARGLPTMAVTFEPHPSHLLRPKQAPPRITGVRGKVRWMEACGLDVMFILHFSHQLADTDAETFVRRYLVDGLGARLILVGYDFKFGAGGRGDFELLARLGAEWNFTVHRQPVLDLAMGLDPGGEAVSSTRIRQAVRERDFDRAAQLLGRPFEVEGRIGGGDKRGRSLGFPTANMALGDRLHPPPGVYVVDGLIKDQWLRGVANLGCNPTFGGEDLHLEVHFLAEDPAVRALCGDLYRQVARIRFLKYLRDEVAFSGPAALQEQIARDIQQALF